MLCIVDERVGAHAKLEARITLCYVQYPSQTYKQKSAVGTTRRARSITVHMVIRVYMYMRVCVCVYMYAHVTGSFFLFTLMCYMHVDISMFLGVSFHNTK